MGKFSLSAMWDKRQKDILFRYPRRCDGALLNNVLCSKRPSIDIGADIGIKFDDSFVEELEKRGYDIKTIYFKIMVKKEPKARAKAQHPTKAMVATLASASSDPNCEYATSP